MTGRTHAWRHHDARFQIGFTLVELIVTLAIAAILLGLATPSFISTLQNNRLVTQANDLMANLTYARSEAAKRGGSVGICPGSAVECLAGGDWHAGRLIFWDKDSSGDWTGGDEVLRYEEPLASGNTLTTSAGDLVMFNRSGMIDSGLGDFVLCDKRGKDFGKQIGVTGAGQARVLPGNPAAC